MSPSEIIFSVSKYYNFLLYRQRTVGCLLSMHLHVKNSVYRIAKIFRKHFIAPPPSCLEELNTSLIVPKFYKAPLISFHSHFGYRSRVSFELSREMIVKEYPTLVKNIVIRDC